jgi:hypothetical protein
MDVTRLEQLPHSKTQHVKAEWSAFCYIILPFFRREEISIKPIENKISPPKRCYFLTLPKKVWEDVKTFGFFPFVNVLFIVNVCAPFVKISPQICMFYHKIDENNLRKPHCDAAHQPRIVLHHNFQAVSQGHYSCLSFQERHQTVIKVSFEEKWRGEIHSVDTTRIVLKTKSTLDCSALFVSRFWRIQYNAQMNITFVARVSVRVCAKTPKPVLCVNIIW